MLKRVTILFSFVLLILLSSCAKPQDEKISRTIFMLNTVVTITIYNHSDEDLLNRVMEEIDRLEGLLSVNKENSDIARLNEQAGKSWVSISPECEEVLLLAKKINELSDGYFDVTAGPLISLWNISGGEGYVPNEEEIEVALESIQIESLLLEDGKAYLEDETMRVNLGGIAKGYIADQIHMMLLEEGVETAIIDLGRNLKLMGEKADSSLYRIGIQNPTNKNELSGVLKLTNQSVVTAGIDERFFEYEGVRYHHILNPFTGRPADSGVLSATIVTEQSGWADALSTSCLLLGETKAIALIENMEDTEVFLVLEDGSTAKSSGFDKYLEA